ncbi:MAG: aspartate/glutamate racemase family protein [Bacteroidales bacterium]|nr:aspartate/glutamate racemase family protein [Bacteroidales bacterium]
MKTIGIIGGTTWISTLDYYKLLNQKVNRKLGRNHSARILLYSVDFEDIIRFKAAGNEDALKKMMLDAANKLDYAGAECLLLGANTMHMLADFIQERISIPLIHIAEETAKVIATKKQKKVGLLGTKVTMEKEFFKNKLTDLNIEAIIPSPAERDFINHSIFEEFSREIFSAETKASYTEIIAGLVQRGAEGIILGCTEIPLLLKQEDFDVPLFNTTEIHAEAAVKFALEH